MSSTSKPTTNPMSNQSTDLTSGGAPAIAPDTQELLTKLGITHWDFLMVGDGSATTWDKPAGFAAMLTIRETGEEHPFYGAFNLGTNIVAEMMAYVLPLVWLLANVKSLATKELHIVTDCDYLAANAHRATFLNSHPSLWAAFEAAKSRGLVVKWHWYPRDTAAQNKWAHDQANLTRRTFVALAELPEAETPSEPAEA